MELQETGFYDYGECICPIWEGLGQDREAKKVIEIETI